MIKISLPIITVSYYKLDKQKKKYLKNNIPYNCSIIKMSIRMIVKLPINK
jgi:hypothetical protein